MSANPEPESPKPAQHSLSTPTPTPDTNQQMRDMLQAFMSEQRSINASVKAQQQHIFDLIYDVPVHRASMGNAATVTAAAAGEQDDIKQQHHIARNSRESIYVNNSNNSSNLLSPLSGPEVRPRTIEEQERRASHGVPSTPRPAPIAMSLPTSASIDRSYKSKYWEANQAISKQVDKFYGDKKHDKDIDVYMFVRSVDFHLSRWMQNEMFGRLELVISCTGGSAQMWLLNKQNDLNVLVARGQLRPEMAEWESVKQEFIEKMGGGQTQRMYQARLDTLKMGKGDSSDEVIKFTTHFREYADRAYPLDKHPDTKAKSLMLGKTFGERLAASDMYVWQRAMGTAPETLEQWEVALSAAWTTEQAIREQRRKRVGAGVNTPTAAPSINSMQAEGETGQDDHQERDEGEGLNAVAAKSPGSSKNRDEKKGRNKFINGKIAMQLMSLTPARCLQCYKTGHFGRECTAPANRAPTDKELKEWAGQR